jgi:zinc transport system substrate-binding protein
MRQDLRRRRMMRRVLAVSSLVLALALLSCGPGDDPAGGDGGKPVVYTTFYPTTYFAKRMAGDLADVVCPLPGDADPIFWQPDEDTIRRYQMADLIVVNGAEFEKWVAKASLPDARVVDSASTLEDDLIEFTEATTHTHGPTGEHAHEGVDGHTWLDPVNARSQAAEIAQGLKSLLPGHEETIGERFEALAADLDDLDAELQRMSESYGGKAIFASHPAYNYLARRYGWNVVNLDLDPEAMPDAETLEAIRAKLAENPSRYLLWESEPKAEIAEKLRAELGLRSVLVSPCEMMEESDGEDYLTVMRANLKRLEPVLRDE